MKYRVLFSVLVLTLMLAPAQVRAESYFVFDGQKTVGANMFAYAQFQGGQMAYLGEATFSFAGTQVLDVIRLYASDNAAGLNPFTGGAHSGLPLLKLEQVAYQDLVLFGSDGNPLDLATMANIRVYQNYSNPPYGSELIYFGTPGRYMAIPAGGIFLAVDDGSGTFMDQIFLLGPQLPTPTPIPAAAALLGSGLLGLMALRRKE